MRHKERSREGSWFHHRRGAELSTDRVILIRNQDQAVRSGSSRCICMDPFSREFNPDCEICKGAGVSKREEPVIRSGSERLVKAKIYFENMLTLYEEGEEIPITDTVAYFEPSEDVRVNDIVVYKGKHYKIVHRAEVMGINNVLHIQCSLEPLTY